MEPVTLGNKIYDIFREEQKVVDDLRRRGAVGEDFGKLIPKFGVGDGVSWMKQKYELSIVGENVETPRWGVVEKVRLAHSGNGTVWYDVRRSDGGVTSLAEHVLEKLLSDEEWAGEDSDYFEEPDMVNHPPHYTSHPSGVECIEITRHMTFNLGNAYKYMWRAGLKGGEDARIEDLRKAVFYIEDEITRLENK